MVLRRILSSLGFGGVDVDTVLSTPTARPGGPFAGQVRLHARGAVELGAIELLVVASSPAGSGEVELARFPVAQRLELAGGAGQAVGFHLVLPYTVPVTLVYGHPMPGIGVGVRTQVSVAGGSAKTDFDPLGVEPTEIHQRVLDALGTIGCRFIRSELRPGPQVWQAITFYAPVPAGQPVGPHIPQLLFATTCDPQGMTVYAEAAARPGHGTTYRISGEQARELGADTGRWIEVVDGWVRAALAELAKAPADQGSFMRPPAGAPPGQQGWPPPRHPNNGYAYSGYGGPGGYRYGGYRPGMGGAVAAGLGGAALGFLGGMVVGDMIHDALTPDVTADAAGAAGTDAAGADAAGAGDAAAGGDTAAGGYTAAGLQDGADPNNYEVTGDEFGQGGYETDGFGAGGYEPGGYDPGMDDFGDFGGDFGGGDF
ncbi:sporulation protein [Catellatospora sp. KI3]|uniref:sporulation protein n=1 Tax=Catellatospora sp. KI3 TaxID=3041620 RepID=UPI002482C65C|nr:sporulation protein [Catellatospora sp. KI3]MDI1462764.1 sporulation protein [Catellatospora sp. KI3]